MDDIDFAMQPLPTREIVLIDFSSLAVPIWKMSGAEPDPNATATKIVARVRALATGKPHVAVCIDTGKSFRNELSAAYKANRPPADEPMHHQFRLAQETLIADGFPVWGAKNFEADDVIASATRWALAPNVQSGVLIVSSDKDLLALCEPRVRVMSVVTGNVLDVAGVRAKFGVEPHQIRDFLALVGDASDNVKGAQAIGEKTAAKLLQKYGNLDDLYRDLTAHGTNFTPALATSLREFEPRLAEVRTLVTLRDDVAIPFAEVLKERVPQAVAMDEMGFDDDGDEMPAMTLEQAKASVHAATGHTPLPPPTRTSYAAPLPMVADPVMKPTPWGPMEAAPIQPSIVPAVVAPAASQAPGTALAVKEQTPDVLAPPPGEWSMQLEPRSVREAISVAKFLFASRIFSQFGTAEAQFAIILRGRELGIPAVASLMSFHNIENKPCPSADMMQALVLKSGKVKFFRCKERTPTKATFVTQRHEDDGPTELSYTIEEARASWKKSPEAWAKSNWGNIGASADMCVARAKAKLCRLVAPEAVLGLYAPEELDA